MIRLTRGCRHPSIIYVSTAHIHVLFAMYYLPGIFPLCSEAAAVPHRRIKQTIVCVRVH